MTPPGSGIAKTMSDQRASFMRSSNGKSNKVANIRVVNSMETVSTQSNVSPSGSDSSTSTVRSRISGSRFIKFFGCTAGVTVRRCARCSGGSMAMNADVSDPTAPRSAVGTPNVMPLADENVCQSASAAFISSPLVTDQYLPAVSISLKWTGSSFRSRSK